METPLSTRCLAEVLFHLLSYSSIYLRVDFSLVFHMYPGWHFDISYPIINNSFFFAQDIILYPGTAAVWAYRWCWAPRSTPEKGMKTPLSTRCLLLRDFFTCMFSCISLGCFFTRFQIIPDSHFMSYSYSSFFFAHIWYILIV